MKLLVEQGKRETLEKLILKINTPSCNNLSQVEQRKAGWKVLKSRSFKHSVCTIRGLNFQQSFIMNCYCDSCTGVLLLWWSDILMLATNLFLIPSEVYSISIVVESWSHGCGVITNKHILYKMKHQVSFYASGTHTALMLTFYGEE